MEIGGYWRGLAQRQVRPIDIVAPAIAAGALLGLEFTDLFIGTVPYSADGISNLAPAWHVRYQLLAGQIPLWTDFWYNGYTPALHIYSKLFYPGWWPMFIPQTPFISTLRLVLAAHLVAGPLIVYYHLRERLRPIVSASFAFTSSTYLLVADGHYWKWLAFPWLLLALMRCTPWRARNWSWWDGAIIGGAWAITVLTGGGVYYAVFIGILVLPMAWVFANRSWLKGVGVGGMLVLPKIPSVVASAGTPHYPRTFGHTFDELLVGLTGVAPISFPPPAGSYAMGFAPVGVGILAIATVGPLVLNQATDVEMGQWWFALVTGGGIALLFDAGSFTELPLFESLRTATRAIVLVQGIALLSATGVLDALSTYLSERDMDLLRIAVAGCVVLSAIQVGISASAVSVVGPPSTLGVGDDVGQAVDSDCGPVWFDRNLGVQGPVKRVQYTLAREGIGMLNPIYSPAGLREGPRGKDGGLLFNTILTHERYANETIRLDASGENAKGTTVERSKLTYKTTVESETTTLHIYEVKGCS